MKALDALKKNKNKTKTKQNKTKKKTQNLVLVNLRCATFRTTQVFCP